MRPNSILQGQQYPEQNQTDATKENYRAISLMSIDAKTNKILADQVEQYIKKIIHCGQVGLIPGMQEWFHHLQVVDIS